MRPDQIHSLRQTHKAVSTIVPLMSAALSVWGVMLASKEHHAEQAAQQEAQQTYFARPYELAPRVTRVVPIVSPLVAQRVAYRPRRLTLFAYLGTLLSRVLLVLIGMLIVATTVGVYFASDLTWRAIELTALILLILYLAERVARARRA